MSPLTSGRCWCSGGRVSIAWEDLLSSCLGPTLLNDRITHKLLRAQINVHRQYCQTATPIVKSSSNLIQHPLHEKKKKKGGEGGEECGEGLPRSPDRTISLSKVPPVSALFKHYPTHIVIFHNCHSLPAHTRSQPRDDTTHFTKSPKRGLTQTCTQLASTYISRNSCQLVPYDRVATCYQ